MRSMSPWGRRLLELLGSNGPVVAIFSSIALGVCALVFTSGLLEVWWPPAWVVFAGAMLFVVANAAVLLRWAYEGDSDRRACFRCRYDMSGIPGLTCPECGWTGQNEQSVWRTRWPKKPLGIAISLALFIVVPAALCSVVWIRLTQDMGSPRWTNSRIAETQARGYEIAAALERFHADNGVFPPSLDALEPKYLAHIPPSTAGPPWWKYGTDGTNFWLGAGANEGFYPAMYLEDPHGGWNLDQ